MIILLFKSFVPLKNGFFKLAIYRNSLNILVTNPVSNIRTFGFEIRKIFNLEVSRFFGDQSNCLIYYWQTFNSNSKSRVPEENQGICGTCQLLIAV